MNFNEDNINALLAEADAYPYPPGRLVPRLADVVRDLQGRVATAEKQRAHIEAQVREQVASEIEALLLPFTKDEREMAMRNSVRMDAARVARGESS